jgi:hypothetical protein
MEGERIAEDERLGNRRRRQIDPQDDAGCRVEPGAIDAGRLLGAAVAMDEDRDQS